MNIGIFTDSYFPQVNGVVYTIDAWKKSLEEDGHQVYVYYPDSDYEPGEREYPFRSCEFKFYEGYQIGFPTKIARKSRQLDIVHLHGLFTMAMAGMYVSRRLDLPRILTYHTPADDYINYLTTNRKLKKSLMKLYNFWEKRLLKSCDLVTVPTQQVKKRLLEKGVDQNIRVLSNGIDLSMFYYVDPTKFKEKFDIEKEKVLGFCGRFGYEKHLEDIISLADDFDGDILLAGKGPAEKHYRDLAKDKDNVRFLGFLDREELRGFYSALDFFIFPSTAETQGLVALESMAHGVPVIGADALALRETIESGKTGFLYEQGNVDDLKNKLDEAYGKRESLSENCLKEVQKHSLEHTVNELEEIYSSFL